MTAATALAGSGQPVRAGGLPLATLPFDERDVRSATEPPEARGVPRDGVRLLVARPTSVTHATFADLPAFLTPGDLVVVNTSATLAAALPGTRRRTGAAVTIHFST